MRAHIIKIISNQYTVITEDQCVELAFCTGKMRLKDRLLVGDFVEIERFEDKYGIVDVYPRKNVLKRPYLANLDQAYILMSFDDPKFSYELVNRLIIIIEYAGVQPVIVVTKADLGDETKLKVIKDYYELLGYEIFFSYKGTINRDLLASFNGKTSVLCGQSGVGKSSILNTIDPNLELRTNITSKALGRGKHTTRHVELFNINGALIADTPGFSSIDLSGIDIMTLKSVLSPFKKLGDCYYRDCIHINEPDCKIKKALEDGLIPNSFYQTYSEIVKMIKSGNYSAYNHRRLK